MPELAQIEQIVYQGGTWTVQAVQSGVWTTGRTWTLNFADDQVDATGSLVDCAQSGVWTVSSTQGTSPWVVSGTVTCNQGTSPWVCSRNWTLTFAGDKVDASGSAVTAGITSPIDALSPTANAVLVGNTEPDNVHDAAQGFTYTATNSPSQVNFNQVYNAARPQLRVLNPVGSGKTLWITEISVYGDSWIIGEWEFTGLAIPAVEVQKNGVLELPLPIAPYPRGAGSPAATSTFTLAPLVLPSMQVVDAGLMYSESGIQASVSIVMTYLNSWAWRSGDAQANQICLEPGESLEVQAYCKQNAPLPNWEGFITVHYIER